MASKFGVVGVCSLSIGIVFINNIKEGRDPFPALMAGGFFTAGCIGISEIDTDLAMAVACLFLLANLLTKSDATVNVITGMSSASKPTVTKAKGGLKQLLMQTTQPAPSHT